MPQAGDTTRRVHGGRPDRRRVGVERAGHDERVRRQVELGRDARRMRPIGDPFGWTSGSQAGSTPVSSIRSADQPPVATSYVAQVPASLQSTTGRPLSSSA